MKSPQTASLEFKKQLIGYESATVPAKDWWVELEELNQDRVDLVQKLADELLERHASIDDFFLACSYSNREGVQENLRFLDLIRQDTSSYMM